MCVYIYKSLTFNRLEVLHHLLRNNFSNDWCGMHRTCKATSAKTQVRLHGSRGGVFVGHRPPRDPGGLLLKVNVKNVVQNQKNETSKTARSFTSLQMFHTHTYVPTYIHTHIHTYMHACIHTYIHTQIHTHRYTHTYIHTYIHTCMHTCIHAYMHTCIHAYIYTRIHAYTHTRIHAYMHTCIHAYMHTCIHADRQTDRHTYIYTCMKRLHLLVYLRGSLSCCHHGMEAERQSCETLRRAAERRRAEQQSTYQVSYGIAKQ